MKMQHYLAAIQVLGIALVLGIVNQGTLVVASRLSLRDLCVTKQWPVTRISEVRALVEELNSDQTTHSECSNMVRTALVELDQLINDPNISDVCSLAEVEKIKKYYEKYIEPTLPDLEGHKSEELPISLKKFALAYGLKVSALCKRNMINSLQYETQSLLKPKDFEIMNPWTGESSLISQIMDEPSDYDDLLLPRDLKLVLGDSQSGTNNDNAYNGKETATDSEDDKIFLQTATGSTIKLVQAICERRFKPIYEQLILPLLYLSNMGLNYQGEDLEREMQEMSTNKDVHQWYRIVYLCESLVGVVIVEDPQDRNRTEGTDKRLVRILSKDEANKLEAEKKKHHAIDQINSVIEPIHFKPEYNNKLDDLIFDLLDKNMIDLVKRFADNKSEMDRIRGKLLKKLAKFFFERLKRGDFRFIGSLMGSSSSSAQPADANGEMVRLVDEYVRDVTTDDHAVSGNRKRVLVGVAKRYFFQMKTNGASGLALKFKKNTIDKTAINRAFYFVIAVLLFIAGIVAITTTFAVTG